MSTPTVRSNIRALPRPAWFLFAGTLVNRFGSFVLTFLVLYMTEKGYSSAEAGAAASAYGVGALGASALGGLMADRLGRRRTIATSMFGSAASMLALSQARSLASILLLAAVTGLCSELYRPASSALLADIVAPERRVTAFAVYRFAINLGFAFGPATAGLLAQRSFTLIFVGDAITSTAYGVIALVALPEGRRAPAREERRGEGVRAILADRALLAFLAAGLATAFVYLQMTSGLALHAHASGLSSADFGLLMAMNGIVITFCELPLTSLTQRLPPLPVMAAGQLLLGIGFGVTAFAHTLPALLGTVSIWTMGEMVNAPVSSAYLASLSPEHLRGRYAGAQSSTWALATVLAPGLGGVLFGIDERLLWLTCLLLAVTAASILLLGPRRRVIAAAEPELEIGPGP
ncbi:MAG: MFS transporter [Gaiellaceae bacterium]